MYRHGRAVLVPLSELTCLQLIIEVFLLGVQITQTKPFRHRTCLTGQCTHLQIKMSLLQMK